MTQYIESKLDNNKYCKDNGHFTKHLRKYNLTYQQYYEKYITGVEEKCIHCSNPKTFYQKNYTYATTCGNAVCAGKEISATKQNWTEEKKRLDSANKKSAIASRTEEYYAERRKLVEETSLEKYGVTYPTKSNTFKDKSKKTKFEKYGNEYYANWQASAKKNRNKTSKEKDLINEKRRETNMELFGVGCIFLLPDNKTKSQSSNSKGKEYTLPSGKIVGIRGYENIALDKLFKDGYLESEILLHNKLEKYELPVFDYININKHKTRYYPDIYIQKENRIIEVKAQWWWDGNGKDKYTGRLMNNHRKTESVLVKGYKYEVWLFNNKQEYEIIKYE